MSFADIILAKTRTANAMLDTYETLYYMEVDIYHVDMRSLPQPDADFQMYLDLIITTFKSLPAVTVPARFIASVAEPEKKELGYLLQSGFKLGILDSILRKNNVSLGIGDIITTQGIFGKLANLTSFTELTSALFVRPVQTILPKTYTLSMQNLLEWEVEVSDTDVVFRYLV